MIDEAGADEIITHVVRTIRTEWDDVCDQARLTAIERNGLWKREFLNPYIFFDQP